MLSEISSEREKEEEFVAEVVLQKLQEFPDGEAFDGGPLYTILWFGHEIAWSAASPSFLTLHARGYSEICKLASEANDAFRIASKIAGTRIRAGVELPEPLREFASSYLLGDTVRPRRRRGSPRDLNWRRDFIILSMKDYMQQLALVMATENVAGMKHNNDKSVCGILTDVLRDNGFKSLTLKSTLAVWNNKRKYEEFLTAKDRYIATKFDDLTELKRI